MQRGEQGGSWHQPHTPSAPWASLDRHWPTSSAAGEGDSERKAGGRPQGGWGGSPRPFHAHPPQQAVQPRSVSLSASTWRVEGLGVGEANSLLSRWKAQGCPGFLLEAQRLLRWEEVVTGRSGLSRQP